MNEFTLASVVSTFTSWVGVLTPGKQQAVPIPWLSDHLGHYDTEPYIFLRQ